LRAAVPSITVAICTHDRAEHVAECLHHVAGQAAAAGFPILLVDSLSSPTHAARLRALAAEIGAGYHRAGAKGLSLARNIAHRAARTEWIVFLDDDAVPRPDWAQHLCQAVSEAEADVAIIGGRIAPLWPEGVDASHVSPQWKLLLSCVERDGRGTVGEGHEVCGANFAIRRAALDQVGLFPEALGRFGQQLISGEEPFVIEKLRRLGQRAIYDDRFAVGHRIDAERLTWRWAHRRAYWEGVSRARLYRLLGQGLPRDLWAPKLAASLPVLLLLRLLRPHTDYGLRFQRAFGALHEQVSGRF
jgi:GT2 family glycosyltransferase